METTIKNRIWEIDVLRGIAIILMIIFHFLYDLNYFHYFYIDLSIIYLTVLAYFAAALFLLLVGISLTLSYTKAQKTLTKSKLKWKFLRRGFFIFSLGLLVTIVTWIYLSKGFIIFGVLHCIGISIILAFPFVRYKIGPFILGISLIVLGIFLYSFKFDFPWLLWLGFIPHNFYTVDYFPLLPWFGAVLIGISLGNLFYADDKRKFELKDKTNLIIVKIIAFLGRHSLIIYLLHQVIFIGIFSIISFF